MLKIMEIKSHETKLTQKQICNQLRFSDSTIRRYRDDINVHSPYKWNNYKKRTTKRKTKTNINSTQKLPKNENSKSTTNKKTKNNAWKGGDPTNNHMTAKEPIEQVLTSFNFSVKSIFVFWSRFISDSVLYI